MDTIEHVGFDARRRHWPVFLGAGAVLVAGAALWVVSDRRADQESVVVGTCAQEADATLARVERRLSALATYIAPAVDSSSKHTYEGLYSLLSQEAASGLPEVQTTLDKCRSADVWWIHVDQRRRRDAYVSLMTAERDRLEDLVEDGTTFYEGYERMLVLRNAAQRDE